MSARSRCFKERWADRPSVEYQQPTCQSFRRSVFETASLRVGRPSAHRQTVRLPVRLACLTGPRVRNARRANTEQVETAVTPHVSAEIVALAGTNKIVIGTVKRWIGPGPLRQHWGFVQPPPQSARADTDRVRG